MARGRRGKRAKTRKPAKARRTAKRAKASSRKSAKRGAAKSKVRRLRAKAPAKKTRAKKAAPPARQQKLELEVVDVETVEQVAPGVALVTDYELIGVREPAKKGGETG
jgi:hypothetical protein